MNGYFESVCLFVRLGEEMGFVYTQRDQAIVTLCNNFVLSSLPVYMLFIVFILV